MLEAIRKGVRHHASSAWTSGRLLHMAFGCCPWRFAAYCVVAFLGAATGPLQAVLTGLVIGRIPAAVGHGLGSSAGRNLLAAVLLFGAVQIGLELLGTAGRWLMSDVTASIDASLRNRVGRAALAPATVQHLEDSVVQDLIARTSFGGFVFDSSLSGSAVKVVDSARQMLGLIGETAVVATFSVPFALVCLASILTARVVGFRVFGDHVGPAMFRSGPAQRRVDYIAGLGSTPPASKEARIFGLRTWLLHRHAREFDGMTGPMLSAVAFAQRLSGAWFAGVSVLVGLAFIYVVEAGLHGQIGLGAMTTVLAAVGSMPNSTWLGNAPGLTAARVALDSLRDLERLSADVLSDAPADTTAPTGNIVFSGVRFGYPGRDTLVFDGLDLEIAAGTSIAVVGLNGAGKTTLVKLLAGLYREQAGTITIGGRSIADVGAHAWRGRLAVIFQDFVSYPLAARDNVGLGQIELAGDLSRLRRAAERAGALSLIENLPHGWDTVLSREFEGGSDLSGGQWQRVALARAMMAVEGGASILVLDEPTANLDVRGEADLFDRFLDITAGLTTVLVSHRFSTVRRADRIVVLDRGGVIEDGTHASLMARGGRYAEMFSKQAARLLMPPGVRDESDESNTPTGTPAP